MNPETYAKMNAGFQLANPYRPQLQFKKGGILKAKQGTLLSNQEINDLIATSRKGVEALNRQFPTKETVIVVKDQPKKAPAKTNVDVLAWNRARMNEDKISNVQQGLSLLGFYKGDFTGKIDQNTIDAIKAFQQSQGLKVDGLFGKNTSNAFEEAIGYLRYDPNDFGLKTVQENGEEVLAIGPRWKSMKQLLEERELADLKAQNADLVAIKPKMSLLQVEEAPSVAQIPGTRQNTNLNYANYLR